MKSHEKFSILKQKILNNEFTEIQLARGLLYKWTPKLFRVSQLRSCYFRGPSETLFIIICSLQNYSSLSFSGNVIDDMVLIIFGCI